MSTKQWAVESRSKRLMGAARVLYHWQRGSSKLPYLPLEIGIEPTNRCNFACEFCPQSLSTHFDKIPATALTPERLSTLLTKLREGGIATDILHWTLDGEPFMNKQFSQLIETAVEFGFKTHHFATNGALATPDRLKTLPRKNAQFRMTPDFCANEALFEEVRGTAGSWRQVLDNLTAILTTPEFDHIHLEINDITPYSVDDADELERQHDKLISLFPKSSRIAFYSRNFHNAAGTVASTLDERQAYKVCPYPWYSMYMGNNGDVVACCRDLEHQTVLGNLFEQTLDEVWNGERYQALRSSLKTGFPQDHDACRNCDMPYDPAKFSVSNLAKSARKRLMLFKK